MFASKSGTEKYAISFNNCLMVGRGSLLIDFEMKKIGKGKVNEFSGHVSMETSFLVKCSLT